MDRTPLNNIAEDFASVAPDEYEQLATLCWDLAINELDVRFMVVRECFHISREFWGEGEGGAVSRGFAHAVHQSWESYLPAILQAESRDEGTRFALALHEELLALSSENPLSFRRGSDRSR